MGRGSSPEVMCQITCTENIQHVCLYIGAEDESIWPILQSTNRYEKPYKGVEVN